MKPFEFRRGGSPLIVSMPHVGSLIPNEIRSRMTASGCMSLDTDWNVDLLYDFLDAMDVTVIKSVYSRYVVDLGRDPNNRPLYAGMDHPTLVPTETFDRVPIYQPAQQPGEHEMSDRVAAYWLPYHDRLRACIKEKLATFGTAVLFDCHSIASVVPRYSEGRIPDLNLGTADGSSCGADLAATLMQALTNDDGFSLAKDGLFKGGYITRHYGEPGKHIHSFQLELSRATYMRESPSAAFDEALASQIRPVLLRMCEAALKWARSRSGAGANAEHGRA